MRRVAVPLILIFGGAVAAQIPASLPSSAPATTQAGGGPDTTPAQPATEATTGPADTMPTQASTAPTSTTSPTTGYATTASSTQPYGSGSFNSSSAYTRRNRFGRDEPQPQAYATDSANGPDLRPKDYPRQYGALLSRSIFLKGRQAVVDRGDLSRVATNPPPTNPFPPASSATYSEGYLVFNGASDVDGQLVAFIENTGMNQIARYHVGDPVGQGTRGKISAITLDSIDYQVGPRVTHVLLGQNLNGQIVQVLTTQPVAGANSFGGGPGGGAPTTGPATDGSSGGTDSVLERLRKRRMQELGQ